MFGESCPEAHILTGEGNCVLFVLRLTGASIRVDAGFLTRFMRDQPHIGRLIRAQLDLSGHSVVWFARAIHCSRVNAYKIFSKSNIDIELLARISICLKHDFFMDISSSLELPVDVYK